MLSWFMLRDEPSKLTVSEYLAYYTKWAGPILGMPAKHCWAADSRSSRDSQLVVWTGEHCWTVGTGWLRNMKLEAYHALTLGQSPPWHNETCCKEEDTK